MPNTRIVAITDHGDCYVFDDASALINSADTAVTHAGNAVDEEWIMKQLSSGMIEWLKLDGLTFESVHLATKITP